MFPELFTIPFVGFPVHSYGLMLVVGLLLAMELAKFLARRSGLNPDFFATAGILALVSGLIGARIGYVIQDPDGAFAGQSGIEYLKSAANISSGGLVYYGGFLLAFPTLVFYALYRKLPLFRSMDIVAPAIMIGLAMGRVGCFLNGCCWGQECELPAPAAVRFPYYSPPYLADYEAGRITPDPRLIERDVLRNTQRLLRPSEAAARGLGDVIGAEQSRPVINTQIISTVTASLIALVTFLFFTLGAIPGRGMALMLVMEGLSRTLIEGMRVEPSEVGTLTLSMIIGLSIAGGGVLLWVVAGFVRQSNTPQLVGVSKGTTG